MTFRAYDHGFPLGIGWTWRGNRRAIGFRLPAPLARIKNALWERRHRG